MATVLEVLGIPAPQGSKRAFVRGGKAVMIETNKATMPWRQEVAAVASAECGDPLIAGPVAIDVAFRMPRPKAHYKKNLELRDNAPLWCAKKPDIDKLERAILDALTGSAFTDDAQVVSVTKSKRYCAPGERPGATITIEEL